jgi:hypothetical protein
MTEYNCIDWCFEFGLWIENQSAVHDFTILVNNKTSEIWVYG